MHKTTKNVYTSKEQASNDIKSELINCDFQTTRTFWVNGVRYIARKTNRLPGEVNLQIKQTPFKAKKIKTLKHCPACNLHYVTSCFCGTK